MCRALGVGAPGATLALLTEVDVIRSVSGGSVTALACALYGERLFDHCEQQWLKRDVEGELIKRRRPIIRWISTMAIESRRFSGVGTDDRPVAG